MSVDPPRIEVVDPRGKAVLSLLREAAIEARRLYPEIHKDGDPWPTNEATPERGTYVLAYAGDEAVGCGALRPIDDIVVELRRMFVKKSARRMGVARQLIYSLEGAAREFGYEVIKLETGKRQEAAMRLYESCGFQRIEPFGPYLGDPISVCFEERIA